jgi:endonuclease/exonuclease/phosphatase family metal-dependent hydrolase
MREPRPPQVPPGCTVSRTVASALFAGLAACSDAPPSSSGPSVTVADLNILHGALCPAATDHCRLPDRIDLLFCFIALRGCPDVVTLQETWPPAIALMRPRLATTCSFPYELVQGERATNIDDETVLTRYPVLSVEQRILYNNFRKVLHVRVDHPGGPLDVFTTHLASGSDLGPSPCGAGCPAECVAAGAATVRDCQAVQTASWVAERHDIPNPALVTGDFNDPPGTFVYEQFVGRGWIDTYLAAGNPPCDPASGVGCTSGRQDEDLSDLESPALNETERIDFAFLVPPVSGATCAGRIAAGDRGDPGEGAGTRLFADVANPFADACGALPLPLCWPSDHVGTQVEVMCR